MSAIDSGYQLLVIQGREKGRAIPLERMELPLGRATEEPRQPHGIYFADPTVSRHHATLAWDNRQGLYHVLHHSTTNPTLVNGKPVERCPLTHGDHLQLGTLECRMRYVGKGRAGARSEAPGQPEAPARPSPTAAWPEARARPSPTPARPEAPARPAALAVRSSRRSPGVPVPRAARQEGWVFHWPGRSGARMPHPSSLAVFYRSMAVMTRAGVLLDRALLLLGEQSDDVAMASVCLDLCRCVDGGTSLSQAMARWPDVFHAPERKLVEIGEVTGSMPEILEKLSVYEEKRRRLQMRLASALTYPLIVFALALAMLILVPTYVFKGVMAFLQDSGAPLPLITRLVMGASHLLGSGWLLVLAGGAAAVAARWLPRLWERPEVQYWCHVQILRLPVLGRTVRTLAVTRFARSMEILHEVGVHVSSALELAFTSTVHPVLVAALPRARDALHAGASLETALAAADFFPPAVLQMVAVGEESGRLSELLAKLASIYEGELEYSLECAMAALEPAMLALIGAVMGVIVVATMLPLVQMIQRL